jgi:hypothetical protein
MLMAFLHQLKWAERTKMNNKPPPWSFSLHRGRKGGKEREREWGEEGKKKERNEGRKKEGRKEGRKKERKKERKEPISQLRPSTVPVIPSSL